MHTLSFIIKENLGKISDTKLVHLWYSNIRLYVTIILYTTQHTTWTYTISVAVLKKEIGSHNWVMQFYSFICNMQGKTYIELTLSYLKLAYALHVAAFNC